MKTTAKELIKLSIYLFFFGMIASCKTYKQVPYFRDLSDSLEETIKPVPFIEPVIQTDDLLAITVQTIDPANNPIFQQGTEAPISNTASTSPFNKQSGYLVDKDGNIKLPFVDLVHVGGLTRLQARDTLTKRIGEYFKNPTVDVTFANFKITILGEVRSPSSYTVTTEKINIFDALGLAGDMTVYGRRENVVLVRDSAGAKNLVRLNLNSKDIIKSPYFYLKQNDVIYVEPNKAKAASLDGAKTRYLALIGTALSIILLILRRTDVL